MTEELFCYDCNRAANTECVEQKHRMNTEEVGAVSEEQQWRVELMPIHGWAIYDAAGNVVVKDIYDEEIARFIVRAVNAHKALIASLRDHADVTHNETHSRTCGALRGGKAKRFLAWWCESTDANPPKGVRGAKRTLTALREALAPTEERS